jgi:hypothetical protein
MTEIILSSVLLVLYRRLRVCGASLLVKGAFVMSKVMKLSCCVGALALVLVAGSAFADVLIPLNNGSFENPVSPAGDGENGGVSDWVSNSGAVDAAHGSAGALLVDPMDNDFAGTTNVGGVPTNASGILPDGGQVGLLSKGVHPSNGSVYDFRLAQQTEHTIVPGETYTLKFYAGSSLEQNANWAWSGMTANLLDGSGTVIGSQVITTAPTAGTFSLYTLNATASASNTGLLTVQFVSEAKPAGSNFAHEYVDNVSLTATPEPSTLVLVASGLLGLLCYAWKKRK